MEKISSRIFLVSALIFSLSACKKMTNLKDFNQVNLVANKSGYGAVRVDPNLINGWGIAFGPSGPAWVSAEGTGLSVIYNAMGADVRPSVVIPGPSSPSGGHPTGAVFNGGTGFKLSNGNPARFIFVGLDGVISGWNTGNNAELVEHDAEAVYTGAALLANGSNTYLYTANFKEAEIEVYDTLWNEVDMSFSDPAMPTGYSPFNIQNIGDKLFVMYAKVADNGEEEAGPGNGYVDIYNADGSFVRRFASRGVLNAPWGVAKAPEGFFDDDDKKDKNKNPKSAILVGNFGNGYINAFDESGIFLGELRKHGKPIQIDGLWAISFAPSTAVTVNPNWLFFASGPNDEEDGLFGYITR